jgi:hypothetical protein
MERSSCTQQSGQISRVERQRATCAPSADRVAAVFDLDEESSLVPCDELQVRAAEALSQAFAISHGLLVQLGFSALHLVVAAGLASEGSSEGDQTATVSSRKQ